MSYVSDHVNMNSDDIEDTHLDSGYFINNLQFSCFFILNPKPSGLGFSCGICIWAILLQIWLLIFYVFKICLLNMCLLNVLLVQLGKEKVYHTPLRPLFIPLFGTGSG